ncbi:MAG: hypothetical protein RIS29_140 [Bacteroidota bacterium]|jgi:hypothetical protein
MYSVKYLGVSAFFENITACCLNLIFIRMPNQSPPDKFLYLCTFKYKHLQFLLIRKLE